jgi:D-tyrosyl-tRNA(Tyr) deacylase
MELGEPPKRSGGGELGRRDERLVRESSAREFGRRCDTGAVRAVVQRVLSAAVDVVDGDDVERVGEIGPGLLALVGVTHDDTTAAAAKLADKLWNLRILDDDDGVMNRSAADTGAAIIVVSQFTLYGDTSKGRRPGWSAAARPEVAEPLVQAVVDELRARGATVATGRFRTEMHVRLVNDGPVTVLLEV